MVLKPREDEFESRFDWNLAWIRVIKTQGMVSLHFIKTCAIPLVFADVVWAGAPVDLFVPKEPQAFQGTDQRYHLVYELHDRRARVW